MRIAVSTDDGISICGHLGRVSKFFIYEVEGDKVVSRELREVTPVHGPNDHHHHNHNHNHDHHHNHHHDGHGTLISSLLDCSAVITNGMGGGMVAALENAGMDPVITGERDPDRAIKNYLDGTLKTTYGCNHCNH